ncbi:MAG: glycosyltransferase family 4 protein [Aggregatilineales bacterium]
MPEPRGYLLVFNLRTDADDPVLGFTTEWLNALAGYYARVDVLTMHAGRVAVAPNVRVFSAGREKGYSEPRRLLVFYSTLARLLRQTRYAACFAHMQPLFAALAAPLLKARGVPITLWYAHSAVTLRLRLAERLVNRVVTPSPESFRLPSRKLIVTGHGIDIDRFAPAPALRPPAPPFTAVSVGRLSPVKRVEVLITAARLLRARGLGFRLRLVGDPLEQHAAYAADLRAQAADLPGVVEFAGPVAHAQVPDAYRAADVMVTASATGSVDKAVLEAMACGLPVIASGEPYRAMLARWGDALLFPEGDASALADRLAALMHAPLDQRRALGLALREIVAREHSLSRLTQRLAEEILPCASS